MNIEKKLDVWTKEKLITGAQKKSRFGIRRAA